MSIELTRRVAALERLVNRFKASSGSGYTAVSQVLALPGLVGFWPGVIERDTPLLTDISGNGLHLTRNGDAEVGIDLATPHIGYLQFDGTGDYFSHADDPRLDILGTESIIDTAARGLTVMAWVWLNDITSALDRGIIAKWTVSGGQRSYTLDVREAEGISEFAVSSNGTTGTGVTTAENLLASETWYFVAGRYVPSTSIKVWLNLNTGINTTSIPASLFQGTGPFTVGAFFDDPGLSVMDGRIAFPLICAAALPDARIEAFYQTTRGLFGV